MTQWDSFILQKSIRKHSTELIMKKSEEIRKEKDSSPPHFELLYKTVKEKIVNKKIKL